VADQQQRESIQSLVGKDGIATTDLKSCGTVDIDGRIISAKALRGYIPQDTRVVVRMVEGTTPIVEAQ